MAILVNKPSSVSVGVPSPTITLTVSELDAIVETLTTDAYWKNESVTWKNVDFIYKNISGQLEKLSFNLEENAINPTSSFNLHVRTRNQDMQCQRIIINGNVADSFVISREQFADMFLSASIFDIQVEGSTDDYDISPPKVVSYEGPTPDVYLPLDSFEYDFTFNEPVYVEGTPSIDIYNINDNSNYFSVKYVSGSGTDTLKFSLRPVELSFLTPKTDINIRPLSPIKLNSGSIRDEALNNVQLQFDSFPSGLFTFLPNLSSSITQIYSPSVSPVTESNVFNIRLVYDGQITITNPSNLRINIVIGSTDRIVYYTSHSNTTANGAEIRFDYTVQPGDLDTNGVVVTSLDLNGATIVNRFSGNAANNSLAFAAINTGVNIDGTPEPPPTTGWTLQVTPAGSWNKVIYGLDKFVVVGNNDTILYSSDGTTWVLGNFTDPVLSGANWRGVCYSHDLNMYVAVASTGTQRVATSLDGITWTLQNAAQLNDWVSVAYGAGVFSAVSATSGTRIMYSNDGITWSNFGVTTGSVAVGTASHITYENGEFLISRENTSFNETRIIRSTDGIQFFNSLIQSGNQNPISTEVLYGTTSFVGIAGTGIVRLSPNLSSWTTSSYPLYSGFPVFGSNTFNGLTKRYNTLTNSYNFFAVSRFRSQNQIIVSNSEAPDGVVWSNFESFPATVVSSTGWCSICYGDGLLVVVNSGTQSPISAVNRIITYSFA